MSSITSDLRLYNPWTDELTEMSIAMYGIYEPTSEMILSMSVEALNDNWSKIGKMDVGRDKLDIYRSKGVGREFLAGRIMKSDNSKESFEINLRANTSIRKSIQHEFKYKYPVINMDLIEVSKTRRGMGIGTKFYMFIAQTLNINVMCDREQYFLARKLWTKLSLSKLVNMDLIDIDAGEVIEKNIILDPHGPDDMDFDERVWDYTDAKEDLRLIIKCK